MGRTADVHATCPRFTVCREAQARWVVHDRQGLVGGLFIDRASAVNFALTESGRVPGAVCCGPSSSHLGPADKAKSL